MDPQTESRLLRLAIAKGLLRWEDLDSIAGHLPDGESVPPGGWLEAVVEAGLLTPRDLALLQAELSGGDLTPDVSGGFHRPLRREPGPVSEPASFPPELRFLAEWTRYRTERFLGSGGMGSVYRAFDPTLGRAVALKFLHRNDPALIERFLREARAQARVDHPNVCRVYEVGEVEGRPYISMQHVDGRHLGDLCEELTLAEKVTLIRDVARAVHAAHRTGLVHRDLKPGNILLTRSDAGDVHPYVVDFGLAQEMSDSSLTRSGMVSGTPIYISPEQAQGRPIDRRTDVYSLGVVLYQLLAGTPPFTGTNIAQILVSVVQEEALPLRRLDPAIPRDAETIVARCLEKDPERRYESAWALAEDLDRFLQGEPIQARPSGWGYRMGKRLRKNRALTAVSAAAAVALLALGATSLQARWEAREKAELAQRFGRKVQELQSRMRYVAALPLHDVTAHKRQLRLELEEIRAEMERLGPLAEGPGNAALGQGYLALHQEETAREHLQQAWAAGERSPEAAAALGQAFGLSYERSMANLPQGQGSAETRAVREDIARTFRSPALSYLREAEGSDYVKGLIAFYEGRSDDAVELARRALAQAPWFYEAVRLEAAVSTAQGDEAADAGRHDEALRHYQRSGSVYRRLLERIPSDASLYADDCDRQARMVELAMAMGRPYESEAAEALAACERVLRVDPELTKALTQQSRIHWRRAGERARRGGDPAPDLATAIRLARRALALDPSDSSAYNSLAVAQRLLARHQMETGADPGPAIESGIEAARLAVDLQPDLASNHNALGTAYMTLVESQQLRGVDPRPVARQAIASFQEAVRLSPRHLPSHINLGIAWTRVAETRITQGLDPSAALRQAAAAFERAIALNPNSARVHNSLGNTHLTLGDYLLARGNDPRQALGRAAASYHRAAVLQPGYSLPHYNLGFTYRSLAQALLERGEDPQTALAAADASLDEALRLDPTDADAFVERARIDLLAARRALRQKRAPERALGEADIALRKAEALNPQQPEVFFTQAQVERCRAEGGSSRAIGEGLTRIGKALAINPGEARYLAEKGMLLLLAARRETAPEPRRERAGAALASLRKAVEVNPLLRREYGPTLAEAERESGAALSIAAAPRSFPEPRDTPPPPRPAPDRRSPRGRSGSQPPSAGRPPG
jgi:tetratricopeptide (TPR) repeat protein/predicted Ser/Thr protein kinase